MEIRPIKNDCDYQETLQEIAELAELEPTPGSPLFDQLDILISLVEAYEAKNYPIEPPEPIEVIRFHLDRLDWTQAELARQADIQETHLSSVLNGHRALSLTQIKKLSAIFDISADSLIDNEYRTGGSSSAFRA